ncbi:MAG: hypothetical protein Q7K65_00205 [Candidatus Buchananbacteria bacterium]|nr:hypothetical protein [Candidatus Buchananbacteria bacterium]
MNLDWKKIGIIALFIGAVVLFGFFIYYFFFRPLFLPTAPGDENINQVNGQLPATVNINGRIYIVDSNTGLPILNANADDITNIPTSEQPSATAQGGLTQVSQLTNSPSLFSATYNNGQVIYYNPKDGKFYVISADGTIKEFNSQVFHNVSQVTWSQNRNKAVLEYPDGSNIIYDFTTGKQLTLPQHWYDFNFSPTDQQIAFKSDALDPENRFLAVSQLDGSQPIILENISDQGDRFTVNWSPNKQMVATYSQGKDLDKSEIYFVGLDNENFKYMLVEGRDFRGQWSPTGDKMVYSVYSSSNNFKPQLWISDANPDSIGNNRRSLGLETWSDKCTFSGNNKVYCAVPTILPSGAGLNDKIANSIADQIYEINLETGAKTLIASPNGDHTIYNMIVNENLKYLIFTDKNNNRIYKINL